MLFALLDGAQAVVSVTASDADLSDPTHVRLPDMTPVEAVMGRRWDGTAFQAPPPVPATVTGNQWAFALSDLGLSSAWMAGVAKSKPSDQVRVGLIARDTTLVATDPLLIRVAGNAGADASGKALVDVPAVFAHAQGMPL